MSLRLFVAVGVPDEVRAELDAALEPLRAQHPWLRWSDPPGWHLTMAFLGWVDAERAGAVAEAVEAAARESAAFGLALDGALGSFGGRVLWAGVAESAPLAQLADRVRAELGARGFELETRPFHAHLTVARAPRDRRIPRSVGADWQGPKGAWQVSEALVMRSQLGRGGAHYEVWSRAPLGG